MFKVLAKNPIKISFMRLVLLVVVRFPFGSCGFGWFGFYGIGDGFGRCCYRLNLQPIFVRGHHIVKGDGHNFFPSVFADERYFVHAGKIKKPSTRLAVGQMAC